MKLLHIVATPRGHESNTVRVSNAFLEDLRTRYDELDVSVLDLFSVDLPAVAGTNIESKYMVMTGQELQGEAKSSWEEIEAHIARFLEADIYLLTVPMWNFTIPYALKYYIDAIVQPGYLFEYDESGRPRGLVDGKRLVCVTSRGGDYSEEPLASLDFVEDYLSTIFGFVGIRDMKFFAVQPMDISEDLRRGALRQAVADVRAWVEQGAWSGSAEGAASGLPDGAKPRPRHD